MEGVLLKWTNYLSGWQPRYFVLDGAFLDYYISQEDVHKGSWGSIKMAACEIKVHPTDSTRMDLDLPGEQSLCLRAQSSGERQRWLVALGSAKACLADSQREKEPDLTGSARGLRAKMSELQLCCHLLVEQVQKLQDYTELQEGGVLPDKQSLSDASSSVRERCDRFLRALEDCMKMCSNHVTAELCSVQPPVSSSSVDCPSHHRTHQFKRSASKTEAIVVDRTLPREARDGETVKRNLEEMAVIRAQKRSMGSAGHQGAPETLTNKTPTDNPNSSAVQGRS
ncbi:hypothetical protein MATL_G00113660 [Megalops atlanticus]|uniref:Sesquipedalian n=1 Tax=Megalops atlanticus TaxID=7932 RepID=A0A9D3TCS2_MEGAT|nr:hypothetical protein MATL_G00113660 [Megalops atlanticus]